MATFDTDILRTLRDLDEVAIRSRQHPKTTVVIWAVVVDGALFVRSARGAAGRWFRDVTAEPRATLEFAGRRLAVEAVRVTDPRSMERVSDEYLRKYRNSSYVRSVLRPDVLSTTLRLDPL